jgi:hypothetical protein
MLLVQYRTNIEPGQAKHQIKVHTLDRKAGAIGAVRHEEKAV